MMVPKNDNAGRLRGRRERKPSAVAAIAGSAMVEDTESGKEKQ